MESSNHILPYQTHPNAISYFTKNVLAGVWSKLRPATKLTPSQWADQSRVISYGSTPGMWKTDFVPYLKEPMDVVIKNDVERITIQKCNQSGGTELSLCIIGYYIEHDPTDIIMFQPTDKLSKSFANDKINTLIAETPTLSAIVGEVKTRDKNNKTLEKRFHGKHLFIAGANSRASFRQIWGEIIVKDDFDMFPPYLKGEGDPGRLADARAETFTHSKKIINISTPTDAETSRIQMEFEQSSQAHWFITCPKCGYEQVMLFSHKSQFNYLPHGQLIYDKENGIEPRWAYYECGNEKCKFEMQEWQKEYIVLNGRYIHRYPERRKHLGYQWNRLISPFSTWEKIAAEFLATYKDKEQLKVCVNLAFGEVFEVIRHQKIDTTGLVERIERDLNARIYEEVPANKRSTHVKHKYAVPANGFIIVISIDVQDSWIEAKVKAWGLDEESFLIKREIFRGSPARYDIWAKLDELLDEEFYHQNGIYLKPRITTIDIQGHFTDQTYRWIYRKRQSGKNVFGIQGRGNTTKTRLIVDKVSHNNKFRVPVIICGVDTAKELIRQRLIEDDQIKAQMHFCDDVGAEGVEAINEYFKGLTAEQPKKIMNQITKQVRIVWETKHKRNEPSDLENYNLAGLHAMNLNMKIEHRRFLEKIAATKNDTLPAEKLIQQRKTNRHDRSRYRP